jgi:hypothetical protein
MDFDPCPPLTVAASAVPPAHQRAAPASSSKVALPETSEREQKTADSLKPPAFSAGEAWYAANVGCDPYYESDDLDPVDWTLYCRLRAEHGWYSTETEWKLAADIFRQRQRAGQQFPRPEAPDVLKRKCKFIEDRIRALALAGKRALSLLLSVDLKMMPLAVADLTTGQQDRF